MSSRSDTETTLREIGDASQARILVTGATDGIGRACSNMLASIGAHITVVARSEKKAEKAIAEFDVQDQEHEIIIADLSSVNSCYRAVKSLSTRKPFTHVLANAGISAWGEGAKSQKKLFHVNHTGHFVLITGLVASGRLSNASIVMQSSIAHWQARDPSIYDQYFQDDNVMFRHAYSDSKMANLMFAHYLPKWSECRNVKLTARAVHPGFVLTNINKIITENTAGQMLWQMLCGDPKLIALACAHKIGLSQDSIEDAALPMMHAAFDLTKGTYIGPNKWFGLRGYPQQAMVHRWSQCRERTVNLWQQTSKYCKRKCTNIDWL